MRSPSFVLPWLGALWFAVAGCSGSNGGARTVSDAGRDADVAREDAARQDSGASDADPAEAGEPDADAGGGGKAGSGAAPQCTVKAPTSCVQPAPVYADVKDIFVQRCVVCHAGVSDGPWPLTSYGHVADWQNEIRDQVSRCTMPPPAAAPTMTDAERDRILMWLRCGLKR